MGANSRARWGDAVPHDQVLVEVVIPVHNEEAQLAASVALLCRFLETTFPYRWRVTVADNASTDRTLAIAQDLALDPRVRVLHLDGKGWGRALRTAWLASDADVVAYMDVDLSTNLESFLPLVAPLVSGHRDVAIGSRLRRGAVVTRQRKREVLSRGYNALIKLLFRNGFSDAQCGFKAVTRAAAHDLLPLVADDAWFFDTELLLLAEARGWRLHEVPVAWVEDLDSRVDIGRTVIDDLKGLGRMSLRFGWRRGAARSKTAGTGRRHRRQRRGTRAGVRFVQDAAPAMGQDRRRTDGAAPARRVGDPAAAAIRPVV